VAELGEVRYVVAPNKSHHLYFAPFLASFPTARGFIAPGLARKRQDLEKFPAIPTEAPWREELQGFFMEGLPLLNETVWFHHDTSTLVVTDLLFCVSPKNDWLTRTISRILGVYGTLAMSRAMKLAVDDKIALARSVAPLLNLPVRRIVLAHDQVIEEQAAIALANAFEWLQ